MQEIAWVLGQVSADGITKVIHALTWHKIAGGVLLLVGKWLTAMMSKPDRPDSA